MKYTAQEFIKSILPNKGTDQLILPIITLLIGGALKYMIGNPFPDLIGHILIFLGCLNIYYYFTRGKYESHNIVFSLIVFGILFIGSQVLLSQIFLFIVSYLNF